MDQILQNIQQLRLLPLPTLQEQAKKQEIQQILNHSTLLLP